MKESIFWLLVSIVFWTLLFIVTTPPAMAGCTAGLGCSLACLFISIKNDEFGKGL